MHLCGSFKSPIVLVTIITIYKTLVGIKGEIKKPNMYIFVELFYRVTIVAACQMYLESFPMDVQECALTIESCKLTVLAGVVTISSLIS